MPLLSTNGTIVPEPVKCYPGSAEGSNFLPGLYLFMRHRLIMLIYETIFRQIYDFRA